MGRKATSRDEAKNRALLGVIEKYKGIGDVPNTDMGVVIGATARTWYNRVKNPGNLTLDELRSISRQLRIPPEELFENAM